ncbi:DUF2141 domain-containing protein [Aureisphaera galaxeae]|uniref:DUF2141 domain-containing protein n=1 Tax=Aureisphaera galaxeae TaxID=1538023 RepID=UPI0023503833|nr:DUF2141 domain-containing protein [Aureisphaera galaxeae]MDC8003548.1 DUF2141 domain-containing protein [Aureisphaera galaxeae]
MHTVLTFLALLIAGMVAQAQNTIEVTITKFKNNDGSVRVGLYDDKGKWLDNTYKSLSSTIENQEATVIFTDVPDGVYAISCYHDKDDNGQLNMFMGTFPSEPYGCSNGARGFFGPPTWEDAHFEVNDQETRKLDIRL